MARGLSPLNAFQVVLSVHGGWLAITIHVVMLRLHRFGHAAEGRAEYICTFISCVYPDGSLCIAQPAG